MNYYKNDKRHQSQPSLWSLNQPQVKVKLMPKINHKRLVLPVITQNPGVGYYSPNLQSIYSNPKVTRLRSVTKIPTVHDVSNERINVQKSHKKCSQKFTILEMLLKEVDEEVDQDMRDNPKCVQTPLQLQPLNDNFIEQLKHIKTNLQKVLRKKL
ncbi:unnamed protein product [Paramecium sonneborni]|uniref:Uncharacterized protein n=1 Tax=Paramecium sonneborni TaxID=65129 RepID=A0A8S1RE53_9CILI|nr:unnamed protein product [Paramecium sonneborni]